MANHHQNLLQADKLFGEGNFVGALSTLKPAIEIAPDDYWVNFLAGRIFEKLGFVHGANSYFLKSTETTDPAKIGAISHYARNEIIANRFDVGDFIDDAISLSANTPQKEYYFYQLLFMRAIVHLANRDFVKAEDSLKSAYREQSYIPQELHYNCQAIRDALTGADLRDFPYLQYLSYRFHKDISPIIYANELEKFSRDTFVVEVGAMDGVRFDALRKPITTKGWKALLIEPLPDMFHALQKNYSDYPNVTCCNIAITEEPGSVKMYRVPPASIAEGGRDEWLVGISSMHKTFLIERAHERVVEESVEGVRFEDLMSRHDVKNIDILQIDTEGHDLNVLKGVDLARWKIPLIQIEIVNLLPPDRFQVFQILDQHGYRHHFDNSDVTATLSKTASIGDA